MQQVKEGAFIKVVKNIYRTLLDDGEPICVAPAGATVQLIRPTAGGWLVRGLDDPSLEFDMSEDEFL